MLTVLLYLVYDKISTQVNRVLTVFVNCKKHRKYAVTMASTVPPALKIKTTPPYGGVVFMQEIPYSSFDSSTALMRLSSMFFFGFGSAGFGAA